MENCLGSLIIFLVLIGCFMIHPLLGTIVLLAAIYNIFYSY